MNECAIGLLAFGIPIDPDGTPPAYTIQYEYGTNKCGRTVSPRRGGNATEIGDAISAHHTHAR